MTLNLNTHTHTHTQTHVHTHTHIHTHTHTYTHSHSHATSYTTWTNLGHISGEMSGDKLRSAFTDYWQASLTVRPASQIQ